MYHFIMLTLIAMALTKDNSISNQIAGPGYFLSREQAHLYINHILTLHDLISFL